jgi:hypothetical protein
MKKIYFLSSLLALTLTGRQAVAQGPTITSASLPQIGYTYNTVNDTMPAELASFTVSAGSGSAQTWNYTTQFVTTYTQATSFVAPSSGQGSSNFPNATMATSDINGNWIYLVSSGSGLMIDGEYGSINGMQAAVDFVPNTGFLPTPLSFGTSNSYTSTATFTVSQSGTPVQVRHHSWKTITADAFGSLTTPSGTYTNTLRMKTHEITADSAFVSGFFAFAQWDSTTNYNWLQNSQVLNLLEIDLDQNGATTKASYLQSFNNAVATINGPSAVFSVYPNPANSIANLSYNNPTTCQVTLNIIDMTGRQVAQVMNEMQSVGNHQITINLEALRMPKGLYFLQLGRNNSVQTLKLSVN